jgi:type VI secretion system secreted protein Hcp
MAQADFFLKIDGIKGESKDHTHPDEIQLIAVNMGVANSGKGGYGSGSGSGKADVQDITLSKYVDKSTPNLYKYCFQGKAVGDAKITLRKAGGDSPVEYLVLKLTEVFVSSVSTSGHDGAGLATESVALNFAKIEITYTIQDALGTAGASTPITIDVKANQVT